LRPFRPHRHRSALGAHGQGRGAEEGREDGLVDDIKRGTDVKVAGLMTDERWQRILRVMDEAFEDYLTGMSTLRKRVVGDGKRKLRDSRVLDHPDVEQPLPGERRAPT